MWFFRVRIIHIIVRINDRFYNFIFTIRIRFQFNIDLHKLLVMYTFICFVYRAETSQSDWLSVNTVYIECNIWRLNRAMRLVEILLYYCEKHGWPNNLWLYFITCLQCYVCIQFEWKMQICFWHDKFEHKCIIFVIRNVYTFYCTDSHLAISENKYTF